MAYFVLVPSAGMLAVQSGCFAKVTYYMEIMMRVSGVLGMVGMCWELVNLEWTVWMPARLLQSLSLKEVFPGSSFLGDRNLQGRQSLQRNVLCIRTALSCATVFPHFIWCRIFLQALCHSICNHRERKWNSLFTRPMFPCVAKNGLGTRLGGDVGVTLVSLTGIAWPDNPWMSMDCQRYTDTVSLTEQAWPDNPWTSVDWRVCWH